MPGMVHLPMWKYLSFKQGIRNCREEILNVEYLIKQWQFEIEKRELVSYLKSLLKIPENNGKTQKREQGKLAKKIEVKNNRERQERSK
jgi:hypothetical protein